MNRKDYISDNLVNIREKLRQTPTIPEISPAVETTGDTGQAGERRNEENIRSQSELSAKFVRESAALEAEIEKYHELAGKLSELKKLYDNVRNSLDELSPEKNGKLFGREIDLCRVELFRLGGRKEVILTSPLTLTNTPSRTPENTRGTWTQSLVIAAAVLLAALIVAGVIALVFRA